MSLLTSRDLPELTKPGLKGGVKKVAKKVAKKTDKSYMTYSPERKKQIMAAASAAGIKPSVLTDNVRDSATRTRTGKPLPATRTGKPLPAVAAPATPRHGSPKQIKSGQDTLEKYLSPMEKKLMRK